MVDLAPGVEKTGIDFRIRLAPITQIHGRFSAGGTAWRPGMRVGVQLIPVERGAASPQIIAANVDVAKGTFELPRVFPGVYFLVAQSLQDGSQIGAFQRVEVKDRPIDVVLELRGATQVAGTVRVEGDNANRVSLKNVNIQLVPDAYALQQPPQAAVNEDGAFSLPVLPGQWRVVANAPWSYVKSVYLGTQDITNGVLDLSSGADGPLRIVMSTNTATIQGTAPPGYIVIAERIGAASPFMGTTQWMPDPNGRFVMAPLAPGSYRLVAVISGGAPADNGGTEVTVGEGETATVEVKAGQ
ncbi:MAG TPA: carboxypeptidase-like regulatory domain-containing protein [Bryobacteraceae bacterium]|nr:carboxypeptidase-like regulatory domain-containing protein [Bryobacteraceae bacterium]